MEESLPGLMQTIEKFPGVVGVDGFDGDLPESGPGPDYLHDNFQTETVAGFLQPALAQKRSPITPQAAKGIAERSKKE